MGVAGLFSFLRRRYPEIVETCAQQADEVAEGETQCDNLYIDLNHIIHACTHPSWREEAHASELEQMMEVEVYLDRLVGLMRPTRLLLVAADGSAPAAKMNQQRGRRFYAAHLEAQRADIERQVRREMSAELGPAGADTVIPSLPAFDGNVITPGTAFMARLATHLRTFFRQKLRSDPQWQHLAVIFSDSNEPGEGEHKILRFLRQQRRVPGYNPNTRHCIYGQDADLILLGLLSHEPHFSLLRESGTLEAFMDARGEGGEEEEGPWWSPVGQQPLELLRLSTLRDCLRCEFAEFVADPQQPGRSGGGGGGSGGGGASAPAVAAEPAPAEPAAPGSEPGTPRGAGTPAGGSVHASPGGSGGSGRSGRSSLDGRGGAGGEVDLVTGEEKKVHPRAAKRRAKAEQRAAAEAAESARAAAAAAGAAAAPAGRPAEVGSSGTTGGGGASKGGGSYDFERILDDVVFCTFLAGNDFLPHVPSLDIYDRPSSLETLLAKYKEMLGGGAAPGRRGGHLTNSGRVEGDKLCWLFQQLAAVEEAAFQQRELRKVREHRRKLQQEAAAGGGGGGGGGGASGGRDRPAGASWMGGSEWVSVGELQQGESLEEALAGVALGGNPEVPPASLWADSPALLRRELLKRVRARMSDRAEAGMAADRVRLSVAGYRGRYYQRCFAAEAAGGPDLEKLVRRVVSAYCSTLCWVMAYYCCGTPPVLPSAGSSGDGRAASAAASDGGEGEEEEEEEEEEQEGGGGSEEEGAERMPPGGGSKRRSKGGGGKAGADATPFAGWQAFYPWHYAPLASDLAKYGKEAMRGAPRAASRPGAPLPPFAQLLSVLPFSSMPACLPPSLAAVAAHPDAGVAALHDDRGEAVFPEAEAVGALVDLSGKKWAHTAVVTLPFPDVDAIRGFVERQLADEEGCRLSAEERRHNAFAPGLLLLPPLHPLAAAAAAAASGEAAAAATAGGEGAPDGSSILTLLLPPGQAAAASGDAELRQDDGVLCLPLDIAGQDTRPFSPGLLPGTEEGERAVSMQAWNRRKLAEQRRQVERAAGFLRGGGRGRGREAGGRGGRGRGTADRGGGAFVGPPGGSGSRGIGYAATHASRAAGPPPAARAPPGFGGRPPQPHPPLARQRQQQWQPPPLRAQQQDWLPPPPPRQQQQESDEEMARRLQAQFDAESGRGASSGGGWAPPPPPAHHSSGGHGGGSAHAAAAVAGAAAAYDDDPGGAGYDGGWEDDPGWQATYGGGRSGYWESQDAACFDDGGAAGWMAAAEAQAEESADGGELLPWLAEPAVEAAAGPAAPAAAAGLAAPAPVPAGVHGSGGSSVSRPYNPLAAAPADPPRAVAAGEAAAAHPVVAAAAAPAAGEEGEEAVDDDLLALLGVQ